MAIQECGCGSNEADWPYDPLDFDPDFTNGLHCGDDGDGNPFMWAYPEGDVGCFVATKDTAAGIGAGDWQTVGAMALRAGDSYFRNGEFTAPREGMWSVTFQCQPHDDSVDEAFDLYLRVTSDYSAWGNPYLKTATPSVIFLGGGADLSGELPCLEGGTLTFELYHDRSGSLKLADIYMAAFWECPIPS